MTAPGENSPRLCQTIPVRSTVLALLARSHVITISIFLGFEQLFLIMRIAEHDEYGYGCSKAGDRVHALKFGRRQGRITMIAGYRDAQLIVPFTIEGACNRVVFEPWLETCLIRTLKPGNWVVVDHATFHHGGRIAQLIEAANCKLVYLPPYSPDLNRIENCWAWLKSRIRKQLRESHALHDAINTVLKQAAS